MQDLSLADVTRSWYTTELCCGSNRLGLEFIDDDAGRFAGVVVPPGPPTTRIPSDGGDLDIPRGHLPFVSLSLVTSLVADPIEAQLRSPTPKSIDSNRHGFY